jgi:hypothetical protein
MLDKRIKNKDAGYYAEIAKDAKENDLDIDDYHKDVTSFVEGRLKYHFQEQYASFFDPMVSNEQNCALHHIPAYGKIDFENGIPQPREALEPLELRNNPPGRDMLCTHRTWNERRLR